MTRSRLAMAVVAVLVMCVHCGGVAADTPELLGAAKAGDTSRVQALLRGGADPNVRDPKGWSALMFAAVNGNNAMAEALIKAGASVNAMSQDGATPLMAATLRAHSSVIRILMTNGAEISLRNSDGIDALVIAKEKGYTEIVSLFQEALGGAQLQGTWCGATEKVVFSESEYTWVVPPPPSPAGWSVSPAVRIRRVQPDGQKLVVEGIDKTQTLVRTEWRVDGDTLISFAETKEDQRILFYKRLQRCGG